MPTVIELGLRVQRWPSLSPTARQLHAAACDALETHGGSPSRFSLWPLQQRTDDESMLRLRIGWLPDTPPPRQSTRVGRRWRFGSLIADVETADVSHTAYGELAATEPARSMQLTFVTPTHFKQSESGAPTRYFPLPEPRRVFRGLVEKWNAFAIWHGLGEPVRSELLAAVGISDFDVRAKRSLKDRPSGPCGEDSFIVGFVGDVEFTLSPSATNQCARAFAAMGGLVPFSGIGHGATRGSGACEVRVTELWTRQADTPERILSSSKRIGCRSTSDNQALDVRTAPESPIQWRD